MAKFRYTGKAGKHSVEAKSADGKSIRRFLEPGEVVELGANAAAAFADRFEAVVSEAKAAKAEQASK